MQTKNEFFVFFVCCTCQKFGMNWVKVAKINDINYLLRLLNVSVV